VGRTFPLIEDERTLGHTPFIAHTEVSLKEVCNPATRNAERECGTLATKVLLKKRTILLRITSTNQRKPFPFSLQRGRVQNETRERKENKIIFFVRMEGGQWNDVRSAENTALERR